ncbi:hypothetical protein NEDG_01574 [Nematocida displodere]|uniref:Uncharacterized protein n=1 Tax=Nematocida displodere TaxID=1805483 RepID=A0A177EI62_9MICR|nr:hypothetical protein NEDG_01574 [Nematocida displodere]
MTIITNQDFVDEIPDTANEHEIPDTAAGKPQLRFVNQYYVVASATFGAGALFMHAGIANGGVCAWIVAVVLYAISGTLVTTQTYRLYIGMLQGTEKEEECELLSTKDRSHYVAAKEADPETEAGAKFVAIQTNGGPHNPNTNPNTSPNTHRPSLTFGSFVLDEFMAVRIGLALAIFSLSFGTMMVYMGLIYRTVRGLITLCERGSSIPEWLPVVAKWFWFGAYFMVYAYLAYVSPISEGVGIVMFSAIALVMLTAIVAILFLIVRYSPTFASTRCLTFSTDAWKGMVVGRQFSFLKFTGAIATIFYAINSHLNMPVYLSLVKPKSKKVQFTTFSAANMVVCGLCLIIGVCGYSISFTDSLRGLKLDTILTTIERTLESLNGVTQNHGHNDGPIIYLLSIYINLSTSLLLLLPFMWQAAAAKSVLISVFGGHIKDHKTKNIFKKAIGPALALLTLIPTLLMVDLGFITRVLGSSAGVYIVLFLPAWIILRGTHTKDSESTWLHYTGAAFMGLGFLALIAYTVIVSTPLHRLVVTVPPQPWLQPSC